MRAASSTWRSSTGRALGRGRLRRELEDPERAARVAARPRGDQLLDLGSELDAELARAAADDLAQLLARERLELVHLHPREQRRVELEVRVLGRRADQRHEALLDARAAARPAAPC